MPSLECDICCKEFKVLYLLKRHQQKKYVCEKKTEATHIYECSKCTYKFKLVQNYNRHIKKNNCNKKEICTTTTNNTNNTTTTNTTNNTINNQLINIIVEKTKKIESLIEENTLLIQNSIEGKKEEPNTNTLTLNNIIINSRRKDNYINAIQLCKAGGKLFNDWYSLESTKKIIEELEKESKTDTLNEEDRKIIERNNNISEEEIWIHPTLSLELALWISPNFILHISKWIYKLLTNSILEININSLKTIDNTIKSKEERIKLLEDTFLTPLDI